MILLYRFLTFLLYPFFVGLVFLRRQKGKEDSSWVRFQERFGKIAKETIRPEGKLVWFYCASAGESLSILPLIDDMKKEDSSLNFIITTTTVSSARILEKKLPDYVIHQYSPIDARHCVKRFLKFWKPDCLFNVDSEIWINTLDLVKKNGIKAGVVNARMTEKSYNNWKKKGGLAKRVFSTFSFAIACDTASANRFSDLGVGKVFNYGNLKNAYAPKKFDRAVVADFVKQIGDRKFFVASSTHPKLEEEKKVFEAFKNVKEIEKEALLILAPRHIQFAEDIKSWGEKDFTFSIRSKDEKLIEKTDVYLADTMGEMALWYELADVVFMGGSLVEWGGHNPFEPAYSDCVVFSGENVVNFQEGFDEMVSAGVVDYVKDVSEFSDFVLKCFNDEKFVLDRKEKVAKFMAKKAGVRISVLNDVMSFIE